jgi:protein disulfide-isomerase
MKQKLFLFIVISAAFLAGCNHDSSGNAESSTAVAADLNWLTDLPKAQAEAKAENKLVLLNFTGSDWCEWCIKLDEDTFSKPEFADYAKTNLVLVKLDFPQKTKLPADLQKANDALQAKYDSEGAFPTLILMKPDGTVIWKQEGYLEGGPKAMIAELDKAKAK